MKILILGSDGMLGSMAMKYFASKNFDVRGTTRNKAALKSNELYLNLSNYNFNLNDLIKNNWVPEYIINCIGIIKPHINKNIEESIYVNSLFPHILSRQSKNLNIKVIHITTDCVYSGNHGNYNEYSIFDPLDIYGKTKSLGEPNDCLVLRTSIIGPEIKGKLSLLEWFLNNKNSSIYGYTNHIWNGLTTLELCKVMEQIIIKNIYVNDIRHIFSTKNSKYEMLKVFKDVYKKDIYIIPHKTDIICDRSLNTIHYDFFNNFKILDFENMIIEIRDFYEKN
jgi:dTDP-4-dehydrorhamnose reductase